MHTFPAFVRCLAAAAIALASRAGRVASAGVLLAAGLGTASMSTSALADEDPSGRVARVAEVSGEVRTVNPEGAWVALPRNQPLSTGDRVITDKDGRATIQVGSSTVRLGAYGDLSITRLDDQKISLHFDHGQMAVRVRSTDILGELTIETDEGTWVPHHPGYFRFDRAPGSVLAAQAWSGDMLLEAPDSSLPVAANQRAEVWREGAQQTTHYRLVQVPVDQFSDWALVQDKLDDHYATQAAADAEAAGAVPPEMTGGADLGRYGRWSNSPDYGEVWTPDALPPGWQPYQDGSWSWISPWGWTWVDDSAWGFAPFHYGRWVSLKGRWCWSPGRWAGRPVYAPALVGWLGGAGFAVGGAPAVGWVALGPGEAFYPGYAVSPRYWSVVNGGRAAPPGRGIDPVRGRPRFVPNGPTAYMNVKVPGALAVVAQSSLVPHAPISAMPAMRTANHRQAFADAAAKSTEQPPPAPPPGHSGLASPGGVVQVPHAGQAVPGAAGPAMPGAAGRALTGAAGRAGPGAGGLAAPGADGQAAATATAAAKGVVPVTSHGGTRGTARPDARDPATGDAPAMRRPATSPPVAPSPTIAPPAFRPAPIAPAPVAQQPISPMPIAPIAPVNMPVAPIAPAAPVMRSARPGADAGQRGDDRPAADPRERR